MTAAGCARGTPLQPTPAPAAPPAVVVPAAYTVTASAQVLAQSAELSVSWTTSAPGHNDWIGLFTKGVVNTAPMWRHGWTDGHPSGTFTLRAPAQAGQYEFRYFLDDSFSQAAVSGLVTVP